MTSYPRVRNLKVVKPIAEADPKEVLKKLLQTRSDKEIRKAYLEKKVLQQELSAALKAK